MNIIGTAIECRDLTICKVLSSLVLLFLGPSPLSQRSPLAVLCGGCHSGHWYGLQWEACSASPFEGIVFPPFPLFMSSYRAIDEFGYYYAIFLYKYKQTDELFEFVFQLLSSPLSPNTTSQNHIPLLIAYQLASDFYLLNDYNQNLELEKYLKTKLESNSNVFSLHFENESSRTITSLMWFLNSINSFLALKSMNCMHYRSFLYVGTMMFWSTITNLITSMWTNFSRTLVPILPFNQLQSYGSLPLLFISSFPWLWWTWVHPTVLLLPISLLVGSRMYGSLVSPLL